MIGRIFIIMDFRGRNTKRVSLGRTDERRGLFDRHAGRMPRLRSFSATYDMVVLSRDGAAALADG